MQKKVTNQILCRCHNCNKLQGVDVPVGTNQTDLPGILKLTKCEFGKHFVYSDKSLRSEFD